MGWGTGFGSVAGALVGTPPVDPVDPSLITAGNPSIQKFTQVMPGLSTDRYVDKVDGLNSNPGTKNAPWATLAYAIANTPFGGTVGVRAGIYYESLTVANSKNLKLQAYRNTVLGVTEEVILDGTRLASSWTNNGNGTWTTAYTLVLDRFLGTGSSSALNTNYPGNARRSLVDQCWFDDNPLGQVADGVTPGANQFSVNQTAHTLTVGSNPGGVTVMVSALRQAIVAGGRLDLAGIKVRRYSPDKVEFGNSMCYWGDTATGSRIENCTFEYSSMVNLGYAPNDGVINDLSLRNSGYSGAQLTAAYRLRARGWHIKSCNRGDFLTTGGEFAAEPATAAIKVTRADDTVFRQWIVEDAPGGYGIWFDVSCTRNHLIDIEVSGGGTMIHGIEYELSDGGYFNPTQYQSIIANVWVHGATYDCIKMYSSGYIAMWNCKLEGAQLGITLQQDQRFNSGTNPANRSPTVVPWVLNNTDIQNCDISAVTGFKTPITAYDAGGVQHLLGGDMLRTLKGNRLLAASGGNCVMLGQDGGNRLGYNSEASLAAAAASVGGPFTSARYTRNTFSQGALPAVPTPSAFTTAVADLLNVTVGSSWFGCDMARLPGVAT